MSTFAENKFYLHKQVLLAKIFLRDSKNLWYFWFVSKVINHKI